MTAVETPLADLIAETAATADLGKAGARKSGRNPKWPYVPVLVRSDGRTSQIYCLAFKTRTEAIASAQRYIDQSRANLAENLADPRFRALREHHGLPRELAR